jgi:hypothetical protein
MAEDIRKLGLITFVVYHIIFFLESRLTSSCWRVQFNNGKAILVTGRGGP